MKKKSIFLIFIMFFLVQLYSQQSDGPYLVSPPPPFCSENETQKLCAATVGAMIMKYWERVEIVNEKDCKGYAEEFCTQTGFTKKGGALPLPFIYQSALKIVASNNLIDKNMSGYSKYKEGNEYDEIKKNMKYKDQNDKSSPWDRPGFFVFRDNKNNKNYKKHALLGWGCSKSKKGEIKYKFKDPAWRKDNQEWRDWFELKNNPDCFFVYWYPEKCE